LNVIYDRLEHGAELSYTRDIYTDESAIAALVTPKAELGVFAPIESSAGPDYRAKWIVEEVQAVFPDLDWGPNSRPEE